MQISITTRQERALTFIRDYYLDKGIAPSLSELQEYLHIQTKRGVVSHLEALEKKGFIIRTGGPRGIQLPEEESYQYLIGIPILGYANAGTPLALAEEDHIGNLKIDKTIIKNKENLFSVIIKGDSMNKHSVNNVLLSDGNYAIVEKDSEVKDGDTVVAIIDNCATIKILKYQKDMIVLYPNSFNPIHQPIYLDQKRENIINGRVVMVLEKNQI